MEREREIRAFKPEQFWVIEADTETLRQAQGKPEKMLLNCEEEPRDIKEVEKILEVGNKEKWKVLSVTETEAKRTSKAPFTTSTLQQTASTRLGYSPANTMRIAQKLYESGYITYMRTDSTNLAESAIDTIASVINKKYGAGYSERP